LSAWTTCEPAVFAQIQRVRTPETDDLLMLLDRFSGQVPDRVALRATDIAVITYTSGTTGVPKGATNTHGNVVVGGQTYRDWFKLGARDTLLGIAPLFHVTGLSVFGRHDQHGHCEVRFDGVRVPLSNVLGGEGEGFALAQARHGSGPDASITACARSEPPSEHSR
jgi:acyl-CoA synthetase (AMP-forming)/AMP-acid ligase II